MKRYNIFQNRIGNWIIEDNLEDKYIINIPKFIGFKDKETANIFCKELNKIYEENQELKAQIKYKDNICRICKYSYLIESGKYYIAKCNKRHEKCSKEDVKYCEDFKKKKIIC